MSTRVTRSSTVRASQYPRVDAGFRRSPAPGAPGLGDFTRGPLNVFMNDHSQLKGLSVSLAKLEGVRPWARTAQCCGRARCAPQKPAQPPSRRRRRASAGRCRIRTSGRPRTSATARLRPAPARASSAPSRLARASTPRHARVGPARPRQRRHVGKHHRCCESYTSRTATPLHAA